MGKLSMAAARAIAARTNDRHPEPATHPGNPQAAARGPDDAIQDFEPLTTWTALDDLQLSRLLKDSAS